MTVDQDRLRVYMRRWQIDPDDLARLIGASRQSAYRWLTDPKRAREYRSMPPVVLRWCEANQAIVDIWNALQGRGHSKGKVMDIVRCYLDNTQQRIDEARRSDARRRPSNWKREQRYK